jgi:hypothetical protein
MTNVVSALLFAVLYVAASTRRISPGAFLLWFILLFGLVTVLWVRVERRHQTLEPLHRVGRGATALAIAVVGLGVFVLLPAFWLESRAAPRAPFIGHALPLMTLTLIPLALVVLANVAGAAFIVARGVLRSRPAPPRR